MGIAPFQKIPVIPQVRAIQARQRIFLMNPGMPWVLGVFFRTGFSQS